MRGGSLDIEWSAIARKRATKTQEGTPVVETYYNDGYVTERFFRTEPEAKRFANA